MYQSLFAQPGEVKPRNVGEDVKRHLQIIVEERALDHLRQAQAFVANIRDTFDAMASALGLEKDTLLFFYAFAEPLRGEDRRVVQKVLEIERRHLCEVADLIAYGKLLFS